MSIPTIVNADVTTAESEVAIPAGTKQILAQCRTAVDVRFAFVTGKVAGPTAPYGTIKSGTGFNVVLTLDGKAFAPSGNSLFLAASSSVVLEILFIS